MRWRGCWQRVRRPQWTCEPPRSGAPATFPGSPTSRWATSPIGWTPFRRGARSCCTARAAAALPSPRACSSPAASRTSSTSSAGTAPGGTRGFPSSRARHWRSSEPPRPRGRAVKQRIVEAATALVVEDGLERWTTQQVAERAGCAKGLVHYHFHSKWRLLAEVAATLRRARLERRIAAFQAAGSAALDRLWLVLGEETAGGYATAWIALAAAAHPDVRRAQAPEGEELRRLEAVLHAALDLSLGSPARVRAVLGVLDGFELALLRGDAPDAVREIFDPFWL